MGSKEDALGKSEGFTLVSQRKKNKLRNNPTIVGQLDLPSGSRIKYAPKMSFLHVYKMHPETIPEDFISILSPLFPESVKNLNSMYPNLYSSFKVTILECNIEKALNPSIWPKGTWVKKIFHRRPVDNSIKLYKMNHSEVSEREDKAMKESLFPPHEFLSLMFSNFVLLSSSFTLLALWIRAF
ncbi:hypothetical protein JTB14_038456 [Gonioctena quinquepunctata]|nr:hypothetical protein JTB14_038456 [Gonioctena quinquepunctata]